MKKKELSQLIQREIKTMDQYNIENKLNRIVGFIRYYQINLELSDELTRLQSGMHTQQKEVEKPKEKEASESEEEAVAYVKPSPIINMNEKEETGEGADEDNTPVALQESTETREGYAFFLRNGGILVNKETFESYGFIPESFLLNMNIVPGTKLSGTPQDDQGRYLEYKVLSRDEEGEEFPKELYDIHGEFSRVYSAVVSTSEDGGLVSSSTIWGDPIYDTGEDAIIKESDIERMGLEDEDIIILSINNRKPSDCSVVWKYKYHTTKNTEEAKAKMKKLNKLKKEKKVYEPLLEGKVIVTVGYEEGYPTYREIISNYKGEFIGLKSRSNHEYEPTIKNADALIVNTLSISHDGANTAIDLAKKHNVPYDSIQTLGRTTYLDTVFELLGIEEDIH